MRTKVCLTFAGLLTLLLLGVLFSPVGAANEGFVSRGPIFIDGNVGFTPANGVTSGSGTANDPYIIENIHNLTMSTKAESPVWYPEIALIILDAPDIDPMRQSINLIKELGGDIAHAYPPHILIGHISKNISQDLIGRANISEIRYGFVDPSTVEKYGKAAVHAVEAWNNNFVGLASARGLTPSPEEPEPPPIEGDALIPPRSVASYQFPQYSCLKMALLLPDQWDRGFR